MDTVTLPAAASSIRRIALVRPLWASLMTSLTPVRASLPQRANELAPEGLGFAVADLEAEQLPAAIAIDAHGVPHAAG